MLAARRRGVPMARGLSMLAAAATLALAGGCATVMRGITQDIQIATDPIGAACELRLSETVVDTVATTPGYVRVRKGLDSYLIACRAEGYLDATVTLEPDVETGSVGSASMGAISGLQGTTGTTLTQMALSTVMPAASAASTAAWLGFVGAVSFLVDLASGAIFEYATSVALTLVPATFDDAAARDRFFDGEARRLREQHAARRRVLVDECRIACTGAVTAVDRSLDRDLTELERLRSAVRVRG